VCCSRVVLATLPRWAGRSCVSVLARGLVALALCASALAQGQALFVFDGPHAGARLGWAVAGPGDVDGDGVADLAAGAPFDPVGSVQVGSVRVWSGASGSVLLVIPGDGALDHFGWSLAPGGDVDGDGRADLVAGAPDSDQGAADGGLVRVVSGKDGAILFQMLGWAAGEHLGSGVAGGADLDLDGMADVAAAAWLASVNGAASGRVEVRSPKNGALILALVGSAAGDRLGAALALPGDCDGDGFGDVAAGADQGAGTGAGYVRAVSSATGAALWTAAGTASGERFGAALAAIGDVDLDGFPDVAIGAPRAWVAGERRGSVRVVSGRTGATLHTLTGSLAGEEFGAALSGAGDLDQDGVADLWVGSPLGGGAAAGAGSARAFSGAQGRLLRTLEGESGGNRFGFALALAGDLDQDGIPDLALGAPYEDHGAADSGSLYAFAGRSCEPLPYCSAKLNSQGCLPAIGWSGTPTLGGADDFFVTARDVLNGKVGILIWGLTPAAIAFKGGTLCAAPPLQRSPMVSSGGNPPPDDCSGSLAFHLSHALMQASGWGSGTAVHAQWWSRDPAAPDGTGVSLSDALRIVLCP
jgi:hypothetical protein